MYAIIESSTVTDTLQVDPASIYPAAYAARFVPCPAVVRVGWVHADGAFAPPGPVPVAVPASCTRRQGRLALLQAGLLAAAEGAIAAIEEPVKKQAAQIEYEADTWERANPFLGALWATLGGTAEELDDIFTLAASL